MKKKKKRKRIKIKNRYTLGILFIEVELKRDSPTIILKSYKLIITIRSRISEIDYIINNHHINKTSYFNKHSAPVEAICHDKPRVKT